jgi:hypothetical protein
MKVSTWLKIASVTTFIQFAGHFILFVTATPIHGSEEVNLIIAMKTHQFKFGIVTHSYWDFYFGYGLLAAITVFFQSVIYWQLAGISDTMAPVIKPVILLFAFSTIVHAVIVGIYFTFPLPIGFDIIISVLLIIAFSKAGRMAHTNKIFS